MNKIKIFKFGFLNFEERLAELVGQISIHKQQRDFARNMSSLYPPITQLGMLSEGDLCGEKHLLLDQCNSLVCAVKALAARCESLTSCVQSSTLLLGHQSPPPHTRTCMCVCLPLLSGTSTSPLRQQTCKISLLPDLGGCGAATFLSSSVNKVGDDSCKETGKVIARQGIFSPGHALSTMIYGKYQISIVHPFLVAASDLYVYVHAHVYSIHCWPTSFAVQISHAPDPFFPQSTIGPCKDTSQHQ